jgi:hypothetical protein
MRETSNLVVIAAVGLLILFLVLLPGLLDIRLVAVGQRVFVVVAGILDILAVGAGDAATVCVVDGEDGRRLVVGIRLRLVLAGVRVLLRRVLTGVWVLLRWVLACVRVGNRSRHRSGGRGSCSRCGGSGLVLVIRVVSCDGLLILVNVVDSNVRALTEFVHEQSATSKTNSRSAGTIQPLVAAAVFLFFLYITSCIGAGRRRVVPSSGTVATNSSVAGSLPGGATSCVLYVVPTPRGLVILSVPSRRADWRTRRLAEWRRCRSTTVVLGLRSSVGRVLTRWLAVWGLLTRRLAVGLLWGAVGVVGSLAVLLLRRLTVRCRRLTGSAIRRGSSSGSAIG